MMGAIGAAIIARAAVKKARHTNFRGFDIADSNIVSRSFECEGCANKCEVVKIFENNKVINKNYSDYDDIILNELDKLGQCKIPVLVGNLLANAITTSYEVQTYSYLVERLIKNNKIKINDDIIEKEK
jgi:hypothetical protein